MSRNGADRFATRAALALVALVAALAAWLLAPAPARAACPNAPVLASSDPGGDGVINDDSPSFTGTALQDPCTDGSGSWTGEIELIRRERSIFPPGGVFITVASGSAAGDGVAVLFDLTSPPDGAYEYKLRADGDASIFATTVVIDTILATPQPPDLAAASDTGDSSSDNLTNDATPTFVGTTEAGASVQLRRNGSDVGEPVASAADGTWTATAPAASGTATYSVRVTDLAGNEETSSGVSVTVDTAAPAPAVPDLTAATDSGASAADDLTNAAAPAFSGTAGAPDAGRPVQLLRDGAVVATATPSGGAWLVADPGPAPDGSHDYAARVTDAAGNVGTSAALAVVLDRVAATPTIGLAAGSDTGASAEDRVTGRRAALVFAGTSEAGGGVALLRDGVPVATAPGGQWQLTDPGPVPDGLAVYTAGATDAAGNAAASAPLDVVVDTAPPAAPQILGIVPGQALETVPAVQIAAEAGAAIDWTLVGPTARAGAGHPSLAGIGPGQYALSARATDAAGNASPPATVAFAVVGGCLGPRVLALSAAAAFPGAPLTLRGTGFGAAQDRAFVRVGGVQAPVLRWSDDEVEALVPGLPPGDVGVDVLRDGIGCATGTLRIRRVPPLPPVASPVVVALSDGLGVRFDAGLSTDPDGRVRRVRWRFGDGGTSSRESGVHRYEAPGAYRITLRVSDGDGLSDTAVLRVRVGSGAPPPPLRITIPSRVLFDVGSAELRAAGERFLARVARAARRARAVRIAGHTDDLGPAAANLALSRERALAVRRFLVTAGGLRPGIVRAVGLGERSPAVPNAGEPSRQRNRRMVVTLELRAGVRG